MLFLLEFILKNKFEKKNLREKIPHFKLIFNYKSGGEVFILLIVGKIPRICSSFSS